MDIATRVIVDRPTRVIVDRIEGDFAVVNIDGVYVDLPLSVLPDGVGEGWVLVPGWIRDDEAEASIRADLARRIGRASSDDDGGDFSL